MIESRSNLLFRTFPKLFTYRAYLCWYVYEFRASMRRTFCRDVYFTGNVPPFSVGFFFYLLLEQWTVLLDYLHGLNAPVQNKISVNFSKTTSLKLYSSLRVSWQHAHTFIYIEQIGQQRMRARHLNQTVSIHVIIKVVTITNSGLLSSSSCQAYTLFLRCFYCVINVI